MGLGRYLIVEYLDPQGYVIGVLTMAPMEKRILTLIPEPNVKRIPEVMLCRILLFTWSVRIKACGLPKIDRSRALC